jgi:hypothetical protein
MPNLYQLPSAAWGDMFQTPDGGVFSVDSNGFFRLSYGPPYRVTTSTWTGNDDGQENSCVPIACKHLGLEPPTEMLSHSQLDERLSKYERIVPSGTVADFIRDHKVGSYFVSAYNDDVGHALLCSMAWRTTSRSTRCVSAFASLIGFDKLLK